MDCFTEVVLTGNRICLNKQLTQKYVLKFLLQNSTYDLKNLAELLEVPSFLLTQVLNNKEYLDEERALKLIDWYLIFIGCF